MRLQLRPTVPGTTLQAIRNDCAALQVSLRQAATEGPLDWYINPGNWGDSLIREGTARYLRHLGITATPVEWIGAGRGRTLLFGGGGRWCSVFGCALRDVLIAQKHYQRIIILPSTVDLDVSPCDPAKVQFFVRDRRSADVVARHSCCVCHLCPDLAFWADVPLQPAGVGTLYSLRRGPGRHPDAVSVRGSVDLSLAGDHYSPLEPLLMFLRPFAGIVTDRLHIAIPAAMLGKQTVCLEGDYFKLQGAYEGHLGWFRNVEFWTWDKLSHDRLTLTPT